ncbi:hypothetical protein J2808_004434 [Pseudarthrobacter sulfonivorans]|nr:hypothetical protein [Pseudarthrobacter sulfonivorans]
MIAAQALVRRDRQPIASGEHISTDVRLLTRAA